MRRSARISAKARGKRANATAHGTSEPLNATARTSGDDEAKRLTRKQRRRREEPDSHETQERNPLQTGDAIAKPSQPTKSPAIGPLCQQPAGTSETARLPSRPADVCSIIPINRLPDEILSEIFLWLLCIILSGPYAHNPSPILIRTITIVCKTWRRAAYATPRLWVYINVSWPGQPHKYLQRYLPLSGSCPLQISSSVHAEPLPHFISKIRGHSSRWGTLRLWGYGRDFDEVDAVATPLLKFLWMVQMASNNRDNRCSLRWLADAPRLTRLRIHAQTIGPKFTLTLPSTAPLTSLHLNFTILSISTILAPLRQCRTALEDLRLTICDLQPDEIPPADVPIVFPALRALYLYRETCGFLKLVTTPILETILVQGPGNHAPAALLAYVTRVPSVAAHLRKLYFRSCYTSPSVYATLLQCFERLDQVEVLRFQSYSPADYRMIPLLQRHDQGRPALLPKLKLAVFGSSITRPEQFEDLQRRGMICGTRVAEISAVEDGLGELGARRIYELIGPCF
ncbi:hypothetical protein EV714DRAFT_210096 [Schizophyllum commune]